MRILVLLLCISILPHAVFGQTKNELIESYNKAFYSKDYDATLQPLMTLLASEPKNVDLLRERAKIAGLQNDTLNALYSLNRLRQNDDAKALPTFFSVLNSDYLSPEIKERVKEYYVKENDRLILDQWNEKVLGIIRLEKVVTGSNQASNESFQPVAVPAKKSVQSNAPICYVSRTGKKYHKSANCSKSKGASLIPMFDLNEVKKRTNGPCSNCWNGPELYK